MPQNHAGTATLCCSFICHASAFFEVKSRLTFKFNCFEHAMPQLIEHLSVTECLGDYHSVLSPRRLFAWAATDPCDNRMGFG